MVTFNPLTFSFTLLMCGALLAGFSGMQFFKQFHTHSIYKLVHNCYVGPSFPFHRHSENSIHRPENLRAAYGTTQCIMKISPRLRIQSQVASQKLNTLISDRVALLLVLLKYGMNLTVNYWRNEVKLRVAKPAPSKVQAKLYHSQTSLISQLKQKTGLGGFKFVAPSSSCFLINRW